MDPSANFNLSAKNSSNSGANADTMCYNMDSLYFTADEFLEWYIANCVMNSVLAIAATVENLVILIAIFRTTTLHTPSYVTLFFLALSDLGVGLLAQPLVVMYTAAKIRGFISMACVTRVAVALLATYLLGISLLSITAVSIDRYLALNLHLRYKQLVTNKRVIALLLCTWLVGALILITWLWYPLLTYAIGVGIGLACIAVTTFCFCRIYLILRHHHKQICSLPRSNTTSTSEASNKAVISKHYKNSVLGMFMVYILLLLCYIPYLSISCVIVAQGMTNTNRLLFELMRTVVYANSVMNPLIYCWRLRDIRVAVIQRLPCSLSSLFSGVNVPASAQSTINPSF